VQYPEAAAAAVGGDDDDDNDDENDDDNDDCYCFRHRRRGLYNHLNMYNTFVIIGDICIGLLVNPDDEST
jgi:hypothetical protein